MSEVKPAMSEGEWGGIREYNIKEGARWLADARYFTRADVEHLRDFARNWHPIDRSPHSDDTVPARNSVIALADRIEALLPPEDE